MTEHALFGPLLGLLYALTVGALVKYLRGAR